MSTIAWDGKTLAADRQETYGNTPVADCKISKCGNDLVGCVGRVQDCDLFFEWYRDGQDKPKPEIDTNFGALVIKDGIVYLYADKLYPHKLNIKMWALGSGADYAMGAMCMGASARKAIEVASELDVYTGMGIDVLSM